MSKASAGFIIALAIISLGRPAYALGNFSALQLLQHCESSKIESTYACRYFLAGLVQSVNQLISTSNLDSKFVCLPPMKSSQLQLIFLKHASDNPGKLHLPASSVALEALQLTFPCKD